MGTGIDGWTDGAIDGGIDGGGSAAPPAPVPVFPSVAHLAQSGAVFGLLQLRSQLRGTLRITELHGRLQLKGPVMIDLIGPMRVFRGDSLALRLTVTDDDDARVDLTTASAVEVQVKPTLGGADPPLISKAVGTGIVLLAQSGATLGQADITISSAETDITPGLYWLDGVVVIGAVRQHVLAPREFTVEAVVNAPT